MVLRGGHAIVATVVAALTLAGSGAASAQSAAQAFQAGKAALAAGNVDSALTALQSAVRQNDASSDYHFWLGQAYAKRAESGNFVSRGRAANNMKGEWERAVALDSTNYEAHRGLYEFADGSPPIFGGGEARMARERRVMLALRPYEAGVYFARADQRHGQPAAAADLVRPLVAEHPDSLAPRLLLISALEDAHQQDEAWRELDAALARFGEKPALEFLLGRGAAISDTRVAEGTAALRRLIALPPAETSSAFPLGAAHYRLGMIAEHEQRTDDARLLYKEAVDLDPRNATFKGALGHMQKR